MWPALVAATIGSALVLFDGTVVTVALPSIQRDLELAPAIQEWVVQAYLLAPIALLPVGGALADRLGRRAVFTAGIAVFAAASLACALAMEGWMLVAGRAVQGVGAGLMLPASLGLLVAAASRRRERRRVVVIWTAVTAIAAGGGPVLGGLIAGGLGWRWIFGLSLLAALAALYVTRRYVYESRDAGATAIGWKSGPVAVAAVGGLAVALERIGSTGFTAIAAIALAVGVVGTVVFVAIERRSAHPMVPPIMFTHPTFRTANALTASVYGALFAALFFVSLFLQQAHGLSAIAAGFALLPFAIGLVAGSPIGEQIAERRSPRPPVVAGCLLAGGAMSAMALAPATTGWIVALATLAGLGIGLAAGPLMASVVDAVETRRTSVATGVNAAVARVAAITAIAGLGLASSLAFERSLEGGEASAEARAAVGDRVFAAPRALERAGFGEAQVEGAQEAAQSAFRATMGIAGAVLLASALLAAIGMGTPELADTGEMPVAVFPSPLAIAMRRRLETGRLATAGWSRMRGPP